MKLAKVLKFLRSLAPEKEAEAWDNIGLQFGSPKQEIKKVLISLDLTDEVFDKAINDGCDLIITHHPFLFEVTIEENIVNAPYKKNLVERIINTKMAVYAMHTQYDNAPKGMPQALDEFISLKGNLIPNVRYGHGYTDDKINTTTHLIQFIKDKFNFKTVEANCENSKISNFAFLPGAGTDADIVATSKNYNVVITSDIK
jgi:dinuclear metal center YbgI/SA1388 family protein